MHCEKVPLSVLAEKFGTPLYIYSEDQILHRYDLFSSAFAHRNSLICYSVKANSNLSILQLLARRGSGFDIVSGGELERVLKVSKKAAQRVVFSGVGKTAEEMDLALEAGILIFNVESQGEVALLAERARKLGVRARVALRVNPDILAETHPYISTGLREHKFGIDIRIAREVYREVKRSRSLDPVGVSVHIGSQIRSPEPFGAAIQRVATLIRRLEEDGIHIEYVDAGGGLGIQYESPSGNGGQGTPEPFDPAAEILRYGEAIDRALGDLKVRLLLEPGRFIVAQAGALLARVLYVKKNGAKNFVITDAGMNDLLRPALYQAYHEILPVVRNAALKSREQTEIVDVVGPVCESGDFFARDRQMQPMKPGDLLAILDAGAYGMSLSSNYNSRPRPAEVLVSGKKARLIRRRETVRDLLTNEAKLL
ncbi:MAG TPA: diaminopimelate decarboxylase [Acidobacteriaceae bacterium]|nr:diaminopimelate decarboxylase [Acidobacteriaceae bacterium]